MDEYFNEEDLINDYINDADEEEPPYEDEYDMEEPTSTNNNNNNNNNVISTVGGNAMADKHVKGGDIADKNNNFGTNANIGNNLTQPNNNEEDGIPQSISTSNNSPGTKSQSSRVTTSPYNNTNNDLYGMERYTGLSSWRTTTTKGGGVKDKGGATTMEATSFKKANPNNTNTAGGKGIESDDDLSIDSDDLDQGRKRVADNPTSTNNNNIVGGGRYGLSGKSGEAQLVRYREKAELVILGRSWGVSNTSSNNNNNNDGEKNDGRCYYNNQTLPKLGEDSMPITLLDGTITFVKRNARYTVTTASKSNDDANGMDLEEEGEEKKKKDEGCLLGVPISELVRRADILQKRAILRKVEREARYGKVVANVDNADEDGANDDHEVNEDRDETMEDINKEEKESDNQPTPIKKKKKKVSFKQETQILNKKRQEHKQALQQQRLWVDKHAPTSISHLLSDERTNREVLRTLRGWDPYVFKKDAPMRPTPAWTSNKYAADKDGKKPWEKKKKQENKDGDEGDNTNARADVRPDENNRVILLSGPPGVGKSTLAHIVCKHAGYRPIEVNASDERSKDALTERVTRAMESTTLDLGNMGGDNEGGGERKMSSSIRKGGKPNCIILDEIDGADAKASIAALVDIIRADIPPLGAGGKGKKAAKGTTYLRRPIILICNHKYAPALRPILPFARQFDVQPPNPERLTGRLRAVLAAEHMSVVAGGMLLHRLVAATGGDVRSCLYALQFASARARELAVKKREREGIQTGDGDTAIMVDISSTLMAALGDNGNGMKDMQSDVTSTVATVFRKAKVNQNKRQKTSKGSKSSSSSTPKGVDVVLKAVDHFGDNSKTLDCLFMNVNRVSYVDPTLDRCCSAFEWLSGADTLRSHKSNVAMNNSAEHHVMQKSYIPSTAAAIHLLCCVETRPDLTFSTRPLSDCHYQNQANVSLVHRFVEGLTPRSRRGVGGGTDTIVSDVIPYGLWLLSAGDGKHALSRPVSSVDILSAEEKLAFSAHVATLRALGLTYVKDQASAFDSYSQNESAENVRLEPEIDKLVKYEEMNEHSGRRDIPPLLKELLAHGASVAAMRERESQAQIAQQEAIVMSGEKTKQKLQDEDVALPKQVEEKLPSTTPKKKPAKAGSNTSAAKNFLGFRAAKAKEAKSAARAARVGFDRTKKVKLSNSGSGVEITKVIRFKYQKGFTQAVRAPCQLEDLL